MKRIIIAFLLFLTTIVPTVCYAKDFALDENTATQNGNFDMYLSRHGISIPEGFVNHEAAEDFYRWVVEILAEDPYYIFTFGWRGYQVFAEQIQEAYCNDQQIDISNAYSIYLDGRGYLINSEFYEEGSTTYNCYSYAIDQTDDWHVIGDLSNNWDTSKTLHESVDLVVADLTKLNYCVEVSYDRPSVNNLVDGQQVIALRLASIGELNVDFHFMKLDTLNNVWRHKPGPTAILTYKYLPSNNKNWTNEAVYKNVFGWYTYKSASLEYDSNIVYFIITGEHTYGESVQTGYSYHVSGNSIKNQWHYYEMVHSCINCNYIENYWKSVKCLGTCQVHITKVGEELC